MKIKKKKDILIFILLILGSESDRPKPKRGRKGGAKKDKGFRKSTSETTKGKMPLSKETISTSESDSDSGGLKIASG